ncbi:MAG: formylmethanofuran dehydrogenase subunit E family protein [Planctomycetes bacterium]|nr:formylmethanofuran dehydrogenase subunit E family protein [Planctomycetota bacterium]
MRRVPIVWLLALASIAAADEEAEETAIVIETDLGLDDAAALALALQHPHLHIAGIVISDGAIEARIRAMLDRFNRRDIPIRRPSDPDAYAAPGEKDCLLVDLSGDKAAVPPKVVVPGEAGRKPEAWRSGPLAFGQGTTIGEAFLVEHLADPEVRKEYTDGRPFLGAELAILFAAEPALFAETEKKGVYAPVDRDALWAEFGASIGRGRARKERVVLADGPLPDAIFRTPVRARKAAIIAKNGEDEFLAQILMDEIHQHLGAYSIIGVKMGLRAAELLNAPAHAMAVVSHTPAGPPVSCMNDGVIVATGSTPGRALFRREPGPAGSTEVIFRWNGRAIAMHLKADFRKRIARTIADLLARHGLEDPAYWEGVERLGMEIWETWHRKDIFHVETVDSR